MRFSLIEPGNNASEYLGNLNEEQLSKNDHSHKDEVPHKVARLELKVYARGRKLDPVGARAELDPSSDVSIISHAFAQVWGLMEKSNEAQLRTQNGPGGRPMQLEKEVKLFWCPVVSSIPVRSSFFIAELDNFDVDIVLGRPDSNIEGMFCNMDMSSFRLEWFSKPMSKCATWLFLRLTLTIQRGYKAG